MDFIVNFLKAVFVERDKGKIKDSIVTIAVVIVALWVVNSYNKIGDGIENNSIKIDRISNYRVIVVNISDSIFTVKSIEIKENAHEEIEEVIGLIYNLDKKRRQEIDYLIKYKDKSYQELMDILQLNEEKWEYNISRNKVLEMVSYEEMEEETLRALSPIMTSVEETKIVESIPVLTVNPPKYNDIVKLASFKKPKKDNWFKRLFKKSKDD